MNEDVQQKNMPSAENMFSVFQQVDQAFRGDDIEALRAALGDPPGFPNSSLPELLEIGDRILHYAIFTSSLAFIQALIGAGADVKYDSADKIPPLFSAILSEREERLQIMALLLDNGADIMQLGYNEWTPLHLAVNMEDVEAITLLVGRGADPHWRAGDDDSDISAFDDALAMEFDAGVEAMLGGGD